MFLNQTARNPFSAFASPADVFHLVSFLLSDQKMLHLPQGLWQVSHFPNVCYLVQLKTKTYYKATKGFQIQCLPYNKCMVCICRGESAGRKPALTFPMPVKSFLHRSPIPSLAFYKLFLPQQIPTSEVNLMGENNLGKNL